MGDRETWISTGAAAKRLGVRSVNTVKRLIRDGKLTAIRPGAHYRVAASDVRRLAANVSGSTRYAMDPLITARAGWLVAWAQQHRVTRVALFGSAARGELGLASDVDVAIDFEPDATAGLFEMVRMRDELADRFGRRVDLGTFRSLRPDVRAQVEREMVSLYEK